MKLTLVTLSCLAAASSGYVVEKDYPTNSTAFFDSFIFFTGDNEIAQTGLDPSNGIVNVTTPLDSHIQLKLTTTVVREPQYSYKSEFDTKQGRTDLHGRRLLDSLDWNSKQICSQN